jgi:phosphate transport system substrate-binding protein
MSQVCHKEAKHSSNRRFLMFNRRAFLLSATVAILCRCTQGSSANGEGISPKAARGKVTLKGSDTMVILGQRWAEGFAKADPDTVVQVTGGGTGTGIAALINGSTDICQASRSMTERERADLRAKRGVTAVETKVALDALAVFVNAQNPLAEISLAALARLYTGETADWKYVGGEPHGVVLYGRENSSGTYEYFRERILGGKDFAPGTQSLGGTSAVAHAVKEDAYGIGYGGIAYLQGIKALKVRADDAAPSVAPSLATAHDGSYPISRFLYFYTAGEPAGEVKKFVEWVRGPEGQKVIVDVGYYPLPKG